MTGPYLQYQTVRPCRRELPQPVMRLHALQGSEPPRGFARVYQRCVAAAADERPSAQQVMNLLQDLQHAC